MRSTTRGAEEPGASAPVLRIDNLSKSFGGVRALDRASLVVEPGEVHGLLGQNGSGKSTLIKVLAGFHPPDPGGDLYLHGEKIELPLPPGAFRNYSLSFVHQNLGLVPSLTVVENLVIGNLANRARWWISWERERRNAKEIFDKFGLNIDPAETVGNLTPLQRALLAIVRAVEELRASRASGGRLGLLVLDEPTPFLPQKEVEELFRLIREIVAEGASVIFVSHEVDEVLEITDRATVLRDGKVVGTLLTRNSSKQDFVEMIVGRKMETLAAQPHDFGLETADITIENLSGGSLKDVSFSLHQGEVLGLTGLIGSGFDEVVHMLFGSQTAESGRLIMKGIQIDLSGIDPAGAMSAGIVLIPGDRQNAGALSTLSVADNMTMPVLTTEFNGWLLNRAEMLNRTGALSAQFDIKPSEPSIKLEYLSGGNQQKVLLAKWLQLSPSIILLEEPTQGVDVGARQKVFAAIKDAAENKAAVLCASSDFEQLATICDRVLIFSRGRIITQLAGSEVTKENIVEQCYRSTGSELGIRMQEEHK